MKCWKSFGPRFRCSIFFLEFFFESVFNGHLMPKSSSWNSLSLLVWYSWGLLKSWRRFFLEEAQESTARYAVPTQESWDSPEAEDAWLAKPNLNHFTRLPNNEVEPTNQQAPKKKKKKFKNKLWRSWRDPPELIKLLARDAARCLIKTCKKKFWKNQDINSRHVTGAGCKHARN